MVDEPDAFADAVIALLHDDAEARSLAGAGRLLAEQRFGWERIGRDFVQFARSLIEGATGD